MLTLGLFWLLLVALVYAYFGYPLALLLLQPFRRKTSERHPPDSSQSITMIIAAYNEAQVIEEKLRNCMELDYPSDKLEFLVVSDGSTDHTEELVSNFALTNPRVRLLTVPRGGKAMAINEAMAKVRSELVVYSDANTMYDAHSVVRLARHFAAPDIGCVCGKLVYTNPGDVMSGKGESFYWRYETALKKLESALGYVAGANGAIYAIRRGLFDPLRPGSINDDFLISMRIIQNGFKCIFDDQAVAYEDVALDEHAEFRRHVRDGAGHYHAVWQLLKLLNPMLGLRAFIYLSHRILRWLAPFIMMALFLLNLLLVNSGFYLALLLAQGVFYSAAVLGLLLGRTKKLPFILFVPYYFCNLNTALLVGFVRLIIGKQKSAWQSTARERRPV